MTSIKTQMIHGIFWNGVQKYSGIIVGLLISMVLSRLLSPADFGLVAMVGVFSSFLSVFSTMGIGPAVIQRKDLTPDDLKNIFTFSVFIGFCLALIFFISSWFIAGFYNNKQIIPICQICSVHFILGSLGMVPGALMFKNLDFKRIAVRTLIVQFLSGIIAIVAAFQGAGVYALVFPSIIGSVFSFAYTYHLYPVGFSRHFSIVSIKKIFSYSFYQFAFEFTNYFGRNLDKIIIGKSLSASALGYYEKSYSMMLMPVNNLGSVIAPVLQPVLSNLQNDMKEMENKHNKIVYFLSLIGFPATVVLYFCAHDLIVVLYSSKWEPAVPAFMILALSVPMQIILRTAGSIFLSCNATKQLFWIGNINTLITITGFIVSSFVWKTIEAIAWSWVISNCLAFINTYLFMYGIIFHTNIYNLVNQFRKPLIVSLLMVSSLIPCNMLFVNLSPIVSLTIKLFVSVVIGGGAIQFTKAYDLLSTIKRREINH